MSRWNLTRFVVLRSEGYRLLFHSAVAGLIILFLSAALVLALGNLPSSGFSLVRAMSAVIDQTWHRLVPLPYSGTAVLALILGSTIWHPLNYLVLYRNHQVDVVIDRKSDSLEMLMRRAMGSARAVSIHLKDGTIHVGYVTSNFNPIFQTKYIKILPLQITGFQNLSGSLATEAPEAGFMRKRRRAAMRAWKQKTEATTQEEALQRVERKVRLTDLEFVLPISEIQSVTFCKAKR